MITSKIEVKDLSKTYKNVAALDNINTTFRDNKIYGLIGPNGSGKTTLIKSLLSFLNYEGEILYEGKSPAIQDAQIAYVPEIIDLYEYLSGDDTRRLINKLQDNDNDTSNRKFQEFASSLGYDDELKLIQQHSKGNLRKLLICQALSVQKEILIMDEPFDGLDPISTEKLKPLLEEHKAQNQIIILSTHLYDVAKHVCDELLFLKSSRLIHHAQKKEFDKIDLLALYE
ncbi:MAG: ATP-binding cassette domain-containing protein [bacterium]|nr:ATP-binding cassette domain-containing protein [bacterium]